MLQTSHGRPRQDLPCMRRNLCRGRNDVFRVRRRPAPGRNAPHAGHSRRARCSGSAEAAGGAGNARGTREAGGPAASQFGQLARGGRP